ncbi:MAG: hypothetical protein NW206_04290 [Hyphomonadaceae bacterium]|nr:hypothetical protein [Hyphomonadaceae bacterium]
MAELVLSAVGQAIGSRLAPAAFQASEGARLTDLHLQGSTEGASIPAVYSSVRIAGQVIWAARFKEREETTEVETGGKGGGASYTRTDYTYSLSFAVGLCEGEVARIGRCWANGQAFDLSQVVWRLHKGDKAQAPDPLIEAIEGAAYAPAYRGLAYIVFEDLPLAEFGNVIPQLSFEVIRPTPSDAPRLGRHAARRLLDPGFGGVCLRDRAGAPPPGGGRRDRGECPRGEGPRQSARLARSIAGGLAELR